MTALPPGPILYPMGLWEPPEDWEKIGMLMRKDFHRKILMIAAEAGVKPWKVLDRLLSERLKGKKLPKFGELPD